MKLTILATAMVAAWAGQARAEDAALKIGQIGGEAMAFAEKCPSVEVDTRALAILSRKMGVNDVPERYARYSYRAAIDAWSARSTEDACAAAELLYGPNGKMAAGILISRQ